MKIANPLVPSIVGAAATASFASNWAPASAGSGEPSRAELRK